MPPLAALLRLRYRLLWAQVRVRRGKVALFLIGYLLVGFLVLLFALGGFGAAAGAIRIGKAELVARILLGGFSTLSVVAAVVLGTGISAAFSQATLRRYPLSQRDRLFARHLTAVAEPFWVVVLALYLGLAVGFYGFGIGSLWLSIPAALLLVASSYLLARLICSGIEWLSATPVGVLILTAGFIGLVLGFSLIPVVARTHGQGLSTAATSLRFTPPLAAAAVTANPAGVASFMELLLLIAWCAALAGLIAGVERLPTIHGGSISAQAEWDTPLDRFANLFGASAPLIAKTIRSYLRTNRVRISFLLNLGVLPVAVFAMSSDKKHPLLPFFMALGAMAIIGFLPSFAIAVNAFGFDGGGFRRYLILPVSPAAVLRAQSSVALLLGGVGVVAGLLSCLLLRVPLTPTMAVMLFANGIGGLFFFNALAVWTSVLAPSQSDGATIFGNDYSLAANVLSQGGTLVGLFGSQGVGLAFGARALRFWWIAPLFAIAGIGLYAFTMRRAPAVFLARRERLLEVLERKTRGTLF